MSQIISETKRMFKQYSVDMKSMDDYFRTVSGS